MIWSAYFLNYAHTDDGLYLLLHDKPKHSVKHEDYLTYKIIIRMGY